MATSLNIGQPVGHVEGPGKVTGRTKYTADVNLPGMLWGKCLRSPFPHAKIVSIDVSQARNLPGVHAVVTGADLPEVFMGKYFFDTPVLARDRVRFVGEKIAAVAADSADIADAALKLIEVEYEELPAVFDPLAAMDPRAPKVHDDPARYSHLPPQPFHGEVRLTPPIPNVNTQVMIRHGDLAAGFAKAERIFENRFYVPGHHQGYIEPHASAAWIDSSGRINVWLSNKMPFLARNAIAQALDLPPDRVRVDVATIGGDFGAKGGLMDSLLCYFLAKESGRPVKIIMTYTEELMAANPRHSAIITEKTGVRDGLITAHQVQVIYDCGAYGGFTPSPMLHGVVHGSGAYRIPALEIEGLRVYTNTVPRGYMRAPGAPQVLFAVECHMDMIAHELGMSPLEFRRRNVLTHGDEGPLGEHWREVMGREALEAAVEAAGWDTPKPRNVGRGISLYERGVGLLGSSGVVVTVEADGAISLTTGAPETGTGALTMLQQVVAEELGVPYKQVSIIQGDTDHAPFETGHAGSRFTFMGGQAAILACGEVKKALAELAGQYFSCDPDQVQIGKGAFSGPSGSVDLKTLMAWVGEQGLAPISRTGTFTKGVLDTTCFSAQIAEVEVDPETGQVTLRKLVTAHDTGTVINPLTLQGQIEGGVVQGLGQAMTEELVIRDGNVTNLHLGDYKLPTAMDIPDLKSVIVKSKYGPGPYAAKAIGEHSIAQVPAAIANAVFDAVGVRLTELPITAEKVYTALHARENKN